MSVFPTPAFQVAHFRAGCMLEAGGAAPSGAVPSGGLLVTGTVTVPVTVSVTVIFVIVCCGLLSLVITPITLLSFVIVCFGLPHLLSMPFLPASDRFFLIVSHFSLQLEAEQIRFLRIRAIEPRTEKKNLVGDSCSVNYNLCKPALLGGDLTPICKPAP